MAGSNSASNFGYGTSGQVLTSNGAGVPASFQDASGGLSSLLNTPEWFDDFVWGSNESGEIGELGWTSSLTAGSVATTNNTENTVGVIALTTSTVSTISINTGSLSVFLFGKGVVTYQTNIALGALSNGTDTYKVWIGVYDNANMSNSGEGIYFTYTDSENSGNWTLNTSTAAGVNTPLNSGVAAVANTYVTLGFVCNAASSSVEFFINGSSVGTITTTIPTTADSTSFFYGVNKTVSAGASATLSIDTFYSKYALTTPRFI